MTKEEFEKKLREKLALLEENEINDIIEEYIGYIEEKMQNGATEEEAIKDFGDIDELARELLKAYKINVEHSPKDKNIINTIADTFVLWVDRIVKVFSNKSASEILKIIIELGIILLVVAICKIPFCILEDIGYNMFNIFQNQFGRALFKIWKFILEFVYLISAIVLFAKIFEKRYLTEEKIGKVIEKNKESKNEEPKTEKVILEKEPKKGLLDVLSTMCLWFIKFMAFWILFGTGCYILGIGICVGICAYLLIQGVAYYGIYLSALTLLILGILVFIILFNFIASKKNNVKMLIISFVTCFIVLGISFSAATLEITTTEYINEIPAFLESETITENVLMQEDYFISHYVDFEVDETLETEIKFEYTYFPNYYKIKPNIKINNNNIYVDFSFTNHTWNARIVEEIIDNLKDHKIYNYDLSPRIKVYTSSANIKTLRENRQKYNQNKRYKNNLYNFCIDEVIYDEEHELYDYCKKIINPIDDKDAEDL